MVPSFSYSYGCPNCGGTCACSMRTLTNNNNNNCNNTFGTSTNYITIYPTASAIYVPYEGDTLRLKQGWRLEVACTEDPKPTKPRAERLSAPAPRLVGGGPMRRRWR